MSKRPRKVPARLAGDDWVTNPKKMAPPKSQARPQQKLDEVADVVAERGEGHMREVQVRWANWDGPLEWVKLISNPELETWLDANGANPYSCTLARSSITMESLGHPNLEVQNLRMAIFDSLGGGRATPGGQIGRETRSSVNVPMTKETFDSVFRSLGLPAIPLRSTGNVNCYISHADVTKALGPGWDYRAFETSTQICVSHTVPIHLTWGYPLRHNFCHKNCLRYVWWNLALNQVTQVTIACVKYLGYHAKEFFRFSTSGDMFKS